jgi:chemotaxis protein methyltransferase CheR
MDSGTSIALTDLEFTRFQALVKELLGIHLGDTKKALVQSRLAARLRERGLQSFSEYYQVLRDPTEGDELQLAIDRITTNETSFFREPSHFELLTDHVRHLPVLPTPFRVWSAAASSGEEAYTIAMVLADVLGEDGTWEVVGTDISSRVLERARRAIYPLNRAAAIPKAHLHRFCLKGEGSQEGSFLIGKALRSHVTFVNANLSHDITGIGRFDVVFLRNVLIYFDLPQKRRVMEMVARRMRPDALLILGHAESLHGVSRDFAQVRPTVYRVA